MEKIESMLAENRTKWKEYQAHRRESRKFAIEQARRRREINAIIEAELNERFGIPEKIRRLSRIDEDFWQMQIELLNTIIPFIQHSWEHIYFPFGYALSNSDFAPFLTSSLF